MFIIRPDLNLYEAATARLGLRGRYTIELVHARTGLVKRRLEFANVITNAGLNALGGNQLDALVAYLAVGTGSAAPLPTDTKLIAELARTNSNGAVASVSTIAPDRSYATWRFTRLFTESMANGNLTEVGTFKLATKGAAGDVMFSRSLLKDAIGQPTTITKTDADQLRISYELRMDLPVAISSQVLDVSGVSTQVSTRLYDGDVKQYRLPNYMGLWGARAYAYAANTMPAIDNSQVGWNGPADQFSSAWKAVSWASYVDGTYYRDLQLQADPANMSTLAGVGSVTWGDCFPGTGYDYSSLISTFDPVLPKGNTRRLNLTLRLSWGRA